jgi:PIN domain
MYIDIFLDTNIYRQLGQNFYEHIDYKSLEDYCYSSGSEIVVAETVLREYLDYYEHEVLNKQINEIEKAFDKLKRLQKFKKVGSIALQKPADAQLVYIKKKLTDAKRKIGANSMLTEGYLTDFLVENKRENKKDNTRDFLIWLTVLWLAGKSQDRSVALISYDRIFIDNKIMKDLQAKFKLTNIEVYPNISSFLSLYGFKSPNLTAKLIEEAIPMNIIEKELLDQKDAFPSHISRFYYDANREFKLEEFKADNMHVDSFYAHKNTEIGKVEIIAHVMVHVKMVFETEPQQVGLAAYLLARAKEDFYLETFDMSGRPVYDEDVRFSFRLTFDENTNTITSSEYLDFFPDDYYIKRIQAHIKKHNLE